MNLDAELAERQAQRAEAAVTTRPGLRRTRRTEPLTQGEPVTDEHRKPTAEEITAIGAFHSDCCDSPVVTTDSGDDPRSWFCFECGRPEQDPTERDFSPGLLANLGVLPKDTAGTSNPAPSSPLKEKP